MKKTDNFVYDKKRKGHKGQSECIHTRTHTHGHISVTHTRTHNEITKRTHSAGGRHMQLHTHDNGTKTWRRRHLAGTFPSTLLPPADNTKAARQNVDKRYSAANTQTTAVVWNRPLDTPTSIPLYKPPPPKYSQYSVSMPQGLTLTLLFCSFLFFSNKHTNKS